MINLNNIPDQYVSDATRRTFEWKYANANAYISYAEGFSNQDDRSTLYNAVNGYIDKKNFQNFLHPFGDSPDTLIKNFKFPEEIRNKSLIKDLILKLMGEYARLNLIFQVRAHDPDLAANQDEFVKAELTSYIGKAVTERLMKLSSQNANNEAPVDPAQVDKEVKALIEKKKEEFIENRILEGQSILDVIMETTNDTLLYWNAFFNFIVTGEYYMYRTVRDGRLVKECPNVLECFPVPSTDLFVENYPGFVRKQSLSVFDIRSKLGHLMNEEDLDYLTTLERDSFHSKTGNVELLVSTATLKERLGSIAGIVTDFENTTTDTYKVSTDGCVDVYHIVFPTMKKVGILTYYNGVGLKSEIEVGEDYKLNKSKGDISIEWIDVPKIYEHYRIGNEWGAIYTDPKPLILDRSLVNNEKMNKLPYSGKRGVFNTNFEHSPVKTLLPFEVMERLLTLTFERSLFKLAMIGDILLFPRTLLTGSDLTPEKNLLLLASDGYLEYDDTNVSSLTATQGLRVIETKRAEALVRLAEIIRQNRDDAWDAVGWNRQRDGKAFASDGKYTTQRALAQSANSTYLIVEAFNLSRIKDYESDLDWSKLSYIDASPNISLGTFKDQYNEIKQLYVDGTRHALSRYSIHILGGQQEDEELKFYKEYALNVSQGGEYELGFDAISAKNVYKLKKRIAELMEIRREIAATTEAEERRIKEMEIQARSQEAKDKIDVEKTLEVYKESQATYRKILELEVRLKEIQVSSGDGEIKKEIQKSINQHKEKLETLKGEIAKSNLILAGDIERRNASIKNKSGNPK